MTQASDSPCRECNNADACTNGKDCGKWCDWFSAEWRKIRADLGIEE